MSARWEVLASGYQLVEGPRAGDDGSVWFTDALGGGVYRWSDGSVETVVPKRRGVGGLALHADGGVVVSGRDIVHVEADGTNRQLFAAPDGVTGFNDICALADGRVLAGALRFLPFGGGEPAAGEFWLISAPGEGSVAVGDVMWSNGCGGDADGSRFYCCDYARGVVHVVDARVGGAGGGEGAGAAAGGRSTQWAAPSGEADGLALDEEGGVWVAQPRARSLVRFTPDGTVDRLVELPGVTPASLAFDGHGAMYVTTIAEPATGESGALLRMEAPVRGVRHHLARI